MMSNELSNAIEGVCLDLDNTGRRDLIFTKILEMAKEYALEGSDDYMIPYAYAKKYRELGCELFLKRIRLGMLWDEDL